MNLTPDELRSLLQAKAQELDKAMNGRRHDNDMPTMKKTQIVEICERMVVIAKELP